MKRMFFLPFLLCFVSGTVSAENANYSWEEELKKEKGVLRDATVEHVTFFPKKSADSEERIMRKGILVRHKDAVATLLFCHGFLCDKFDVAIFRSLFPKGRFNFLTFDFRGHGEEADGQVSTLGRDEALDVIAAAEFIKNHEDIKELPLIAWAFSMGAVAAIEAEGKAKNLFAGMVLDCPFESSEGLIERSFDRMRFSVLGYQFDFPGRSILQKYALHPYVQSFIQTLFKTVLNLDAQHVVLQAKHTYPIKSIESIKVPCFFIHCKNDEKIPVDTIKRLYAKKDGHKRLWITNGRRHFDSLFYNPEHYVYRVVKFVEQVASGVIYNKKKEKVIVDPDETVVLTKRRRYEERSTSVNAC